ncbi:hypothetical protein [Egbenema bharatensis]|uniref:hypothetical protein n=1 Tax=Egbenema bharatensis TaxID=3463334 RepID=UPI003A88F4CE
MLQTISIEDNDSTNRLIKAWATRYLPDLVSLSHPNKRFPAAELVEAACPDGRAKTIQTVRRILELNCQLASLEATSVYSYVPNILQLSETRRIAQSANRVYEQVLHLYGQHQPPNHFLKFIDSSPELFSRLTLPFLVLPAISHLAKEIEPTLLAVQKEHIQAGDPRAIGFLTTQFHFMSREITKQLNPYEQVLLTPYLKFIEEQSCIPWQRVCAAASCQSTNAPIFIMVERLLPLCQPIAEATYHRAQQNYPEHRSRQGKLSQAAVARSTLRDLVMIQGYLWLSFLEGNLTRIKHELLPLCVMVFPSISVSWTLVEHVLALLFEEILTHLTLPEKALVLPYLQSIRKLFGTCK